MNDDPQTTIREQVPSDARLFALKPNSKQPDTEHAHLDAVALDEFLELYVSGNYGIALDGQYLLVDKDRDDEIVRAFEAKLPDTWMQKTWRRGTHRLYRVPADFKGKNTTWPGGEIKVNGYLVGPGSVVREGAVSGAYVRLNTIAPVDAPSWMLELCERADAPELDIGERDVMQAGATGGPGRDNELAAFAGFMRRRGYSETFMAGALAGIVDSGVVEQPPGDEITAHDIARIARSVAHYTPEVGGPGPIAASEWLCGSDVALVGPPIEWWVRGFFPKAEFVTLFGASGAGKSTLGSWLAALVSRTGPFLFVGVEEPFPRFLARSVLGGGDRSKIFALRQAARFVIPRDIPKLREQVLLAGVQCVYFDSIITHFEHVQGQNIAERTRRCLGPLAEMAQEIGVGVVGVFHENRDGDYMGSAEMVNVARVTLRASRTGNDMPMQLEVHTTNLWQPDYGLSYAAPEQPLKDPDTGKVQMEVDERGELKPMVVRVAAMVGEHKLGVRVGDLPDVE